MKLKLSIFLLFISSIYSQAQSFHDTQGKLEISASGQAVYTLPIAMPPSIQDVGPVINLVYASGQMGGIAGQGWSINSISAITRMATRIDIDGFIDGVDFDDNDKLALDGQRLLLKSGTYWADGSIYETEVQSNTKVELKGTGDGIYFIVTAPDGSKSFYGNYIGNNASDLTAYYITRFEDVKGNFITYEYFKPFAKNLCVKQINFSANTNGNVTPLNKIVFSYKQAARSESMYIKGILLVKVELLDKIEVFTNNLLFKKYQLTHETDPQLGYQRVSQVQEFNGALDPANPVIFNYNTTTSTNIGSESVKNFTNTIDFGSTKMGGDFDGDGKLDFVTDNAMFTKLFDGSNTIAPTNLPITSPNFAITTLTGSKLNQFQSLLYIKANANSIDFKVYNKNSSGINLNYYKKYINTIRPNYCSF